MMEEIHEVWGILGVEALKDKLLMTGLCSPP